MRAVERSGPIGAQPVRLMAASASIKSFLADLPVAPGMQISPLSRRRSSSPRNEQPHLGPDFVAFDPKRLISASGEVPNALAIEPLIRLRHATQDSKPVQFSI